MSGILFFSFASCHPLKKSCIIEVVYNRGVISPSTPLVDKYCRKSQKTKQYQIGDVILAATPGGHLNVKMGSKNSLKNWSFFHNPALYVRK